MSAEVTTPETDMTPTTAAAAEDASDPAAEARRRRLIAGWLFAVAAMVFAMVVLGGLTRLTDSGLSMVDWRPITGWLPPLTEAEWQRAFDAYKQYPEYREYNEGMTLAGFKGIFWLEFLHRLFGRLIGAVFLVPFVVFLAKGWIARPLVPKLVAMFVLGGLQGVMGWWMVKSGLVDEPDVSQYRLAAHLVLALVILAYVLWVALALWWPEGERQSGPVRRLARPAAAVLALVFVTAFSGALVAGLDAGLTYNTFPLMDGALVPEGLWADAPWHLNPFENIVTVQFDHRVLALATLAAVVALWAALRRRGAGGRAARAADLAAGMAVLQVALGIATLVLVVPLSLASLHQAGAVVFLALVLWTLAEVARARP